MKHPLISLVFLSGIAEVSAQSRSADSERLDAFRGVGLAPEAINERIRSLGQGLAEDRRARGQFFQRNTVARSRSRDDNCDAQDDNVVELCTNGELDELLIFPPRNGDLARTVLQMAFFRRTLELRFDHFRVAREEATDFLDYLSNQNHIDFPTPGRGDSERDLAKTNHFRHYQSIAESVARLAWIRKQKENIQQAKVPLNSCISSDFGRSTSRPRCEQEFNALIDKERALDALAATILSQEPILTRPELEDAIDDAYRNNVFDGVEMTADASGNIDLTVSADAKRRVMEPESGGRNGLGRRLHRALAATA